MIGYIAGFTFYTLAIIGVIMIAFVVAKKSMHPSCMSGKKENFLDIEHSLRIAPKNTIQVVRAGQERFLIAIDTDKTTFLTKLSTDINIQQILEVDENPENIVKKRVTTNASVMRSVLEKLNT